jgi:DNA (cytosine-5)-methyltransferase 1
MDRPKIAIFSFFSGSGFLDLGFELAGFNVVYANEIFPAFMDAYRHSRKCLNLPEPEYGHGEGEKGDVTKLAEGASAVRLRDLVKDAGKNHKFVGFIAGPPCPDFSVGGKNRGGEGDKGKLSASYTELICQQQPDFFIFENVKGLWSNKQHKTFYDSLKKQLAEVGYVFVERLINAIEYGVPQDRDRIILIGFRKKIVQDMGIDLQEYNTMLPVGLFPWSSQILYPRLEVFSNPWPGTVPFSCFAELPCPDNIPKELTVEYWFKKNEVTSHPNAKHCFQVKAGRQRFATVAEGDVSRKSYKRLHRWRYSPTACYGNNEVHLHPYEIRRLSVAETLAIQSLPKNFALPDSMTLSNMFKTVGNGVPYLASKGIAQTIAKFLNR